ncbi:MAG: hypothetical protein J7M38_14875 [Armatimonadetes bacterium]|nr:hypothetical protein [Armatimonadota bacterium]
MAVSNVVLTPIQELAPGQVTAIRDSVIKAVVEKASRELSLPESQLVVRDIRAYDDLKFGANTDYMATATSTNVWGTFKHSNSYVASAAGGGNYCDAIPDNTTMADNRYVAIYGVRDWRMSRPSTVNANISLVKFETGYADRAIWDVTACESYRNFIAGVTPSAVIIPPRTPYQISPYLIADSVELAFQLMGVVVEPVGLTFVPDEDPAGKARQTNLVPVAELAPGAVSKIRNDVIAKVVAMATRELGVSSDELVVRDIRPYSDLAWCTTTDAVTSALSTDTWIATSDDSKVYGSFVGCVTSGSTTMDDDRFVAIYGVKDMRMCLGTPVEMALSMLKLHVGGDDKAIWDLQNMEAYPNAMAAVVSSASSAVIIPQNTEYQIYVYGGLSDDGASTDIAQYIMLEGVVVEKRGKVLSP